MHRDTKLVWAHFLHLSSWGFFYVLPMIETPFLARTIGVVQLGKIEFVKALMYYFFILIGYGFRYSAAQQIAFHKEKKHTIGQITSAVYAIQLIGILLSLLIIGLLILFVPKIQQVKTCLLSYFPALVGSILCPVFIFQGLEKMRWMTYINFIFQFLFLLGLFSCIRTPSDVLLYPIFYAIAYLLRLVVALYLIYHTLAIPISLPTWAMIRLQLKEGLYIFCSHLSITFYSRLPGLFLGFFATPGSVAVYALGVRVVKTTQHMIGHFTQALFPVVSRKIRQSLQEGLHFLAKISIASALLLLLIGLAYLLWAPSIIQCLAGSTHQEACRILTLHALLPLIVLLANMLSMGVLVPIGAGKHYTLTMLLTSLLCLLLHCLLVPTRKAQGAAMAMLGSEMFALLTMACVAYHKIVRR